jgi:uncharacterized cupin superfamily protein
MRPSPIVPGWITEGTPVARVAVLSRSDDQTTTTVVWDCTAGKFDWTYDCDETIHIVEGSIVLSDAGNPPKRLGAGDVVFFPKGAQVSWEVDGYVRKVAILRKVVPNPLTIVFKTLRRVKRLIKGTPGQDSMAGLSGETGRRAPGFNSRPASV